MISSIGRLLYLVVIAVGGFFAIIFVVPLLSSSLPTRAVLYPLPHQIAKYPGGTSFRFAMVHDVVHDRYPRHGKAYYQERNRRILATIAKQKDADGLPPPEQFGLIDDLGVGFDTLGDSAEATRWLRLKLKAQEKLGLEGKALYTSYANFGTFIIHGNAAKAMNGDKDAQDAVREGIGFLRKSIEVNPEAHFGREIWQAVIAEFLLAASKEPELLLKYDMVGNPLTVGVQRVPRAGSFGVRSDAAREQAVRRVAAFLKNQGDIQDRTELRGNIFHIGFSESVLPGWKPVPFDEPCLGIIGMWRLGGGANPHFALALGETMMHVNQRRLAWAAYQRAILEAKRFSAHEAIRARLIDHCKARQVALDFSDAESKELAGRFESELQIGQSYQRDYQKFEEEQIAAGKDLDDPHAYDAFHAVHANIATPVGDADFLAVEEVTLRTKSSLIFAGGALVFVAALLWLRRQRRGRQPKPA